MNIRIGSDEWYPVYCVSTDRYDTECDIPPETLERWKRISEEFDAMQTEMRDALKAANSEKAPSDAPPYSVAVDLARDTVELKPATP